MMRDVIKLWVSVYCANNAICGLISIIEHKTTTSNFNQHQYNSIDDGIEMHLKYTRHLLQNYSIDNRQYEIPVHAQIRIQQR